MSSFRQPVQRRCPREEASLRECRPPFLFPFSPRVRFHPRRPGVRNGFPGPRRRNWPRGARGRDVVVVVVVVVVVGGPWSDTRGGPCGRRPRALSRARRQGGEREGGWRSSSSGIVAVVVGEGLLGTALKAEAKLTQNRRHPSRPPPPLQGGPPDAKGPHPEPSPRGGQLRSSRTDTRRRCRTTRTRRRTVGC